MAETLDIEAELTQSAPTEPENKGAVAIAEPKPEQRASLEAGEAVSPIIPRTLEEVARIATAVIRAGLVPRSYEGTDPEATRAKLMIGIMKGLEVGYGPITALSTIMVVNNRPSIWGDGAMALASRDGKVEWVKQRYEGTEGEEDWTAIFEVKRVNQAEPYVGRFSVKDAKRAHLWLNTKKQPWIEYPQRMLMARARAYALREGFADCLMGLGIAEEVQDIPTPPKAVESGILDDALPAPEPATDAAA